MTPKRNEYGEHENRTPGDRRSSCVIEPPVPVCQEKMRALREVFDIESKAVADALVQRSREVDAHFTTLNNAQARLDKDRDEFLRLELYKSEHQNVVNRVEKISAKIGEIQLWRAGIEGKSSRSNLVAVVAIIISIIFGMLHFYQGAK